MPEEPESAAKSSKDPKPRAEKPERLKTAVRNRKKENRYEIRKNYSFRKKTEASEETVTVRICIIRGSSYDPG